MIRMENLTKTFGNLTAVDRLTLAVPAGEVFCFLGPNGAGKTTTMKMMTGLLRPTSGGVWIDGLDVQSQPVEAKRRIGYIPDMPYLYERLTAAEFFDFVGSLYGIAPAEIRRDMEESFGTFGLLDSRNILVRDLSHGMRQRLIYCATFLHRPKVLLVDEPLIGLDPHTIRLLKSLLRRRAAEGMAIFLTTHILSLAEDVADRIGIILGGRLVALGTLGELLSAHGGPRLEDVFVRITAGAAPAGGRP